MTSNLPADACLQRDLCGLLYPSGAPYVLIQSLENKLTHFFSTARLHVHYVADMWQKIGQTPQVGCSDHFITLTQSVVRFYCLTRLHFFLKGVNKKRMEKREPSGLSPKENFLLQSSNKLALCTNVFSFKLIFFFFLPMKRTPDGLTSG